MQREHRRRCGVCDSLNRELICPPCISTSLEEKNRLLQSLQRQREIIAQRLSAFLQVKQAFREQQLKRIHRGKHIQQLRSSIDRVKEQIEAGREEVQVLQKQNGSRRRKYERYKESLTSMCAKMLSDHFPTLIRYQSLTYSHVRAMLYKEQRAKIKELFEIFPVRINALRSGNGSPIQITICNLRFPDSLWPGAMSWSEAQVQQANAAVGYMLLFLDIMSAYLGGPVLHEGMFQGSSSMLWRPHSFWSRSPAPHSTPLPLHISGPAASAISNQLSNISQRVRTSGSIWSQLTNLTSFSGQGNSNQGAQYSALGQADTPDSSRSAGGSGNPGGAAGDARIHMRSSTEAKAAFDLLQRSMSCFLQDRAATLSIVLPPMWSPAAWMVMVVAIIKKDIKAAGPIMAASTLAEVLPGDGLSMLLTTPIGVPHNLSSMAFEGDEDEDESDGWDMIRAPFLPPTPSQPDDVEHWTRAMFTDAKSNAALGAISNERMRTLFARV